MLGGYIGSDAFTLHQLQKHLAKLQQSTKNLIGLPNRQIRMLLLRLCFRPKIHFLFCFSRRRGNYIKESLTTTSFTHANDVGGYLLHGYDHRRLLARF